MPYLLNLSQWLIHANYHPFYGYLAIRKDYTVEVNCNPNDLFLSKRHSDSM